MFNEKLSYLMVITNTANIELAKFLLISTSCISRWKNGKRKPPKNSSYIATISKYLATKIKNNNLMHNFNNIFNFKNSSDFDSKLEAWLNNSDDNFEFSNVHTINETTKMFYYGDKGKKDAVIRFLTNAKNKTNQVLLLYSDESMNWILDEEFSKKWSKLLISVLKNNNKIKIIHTISREYNEMFEAISKWLPMYLTGKIEPFYFKKLRDGVMRATLFISSDEAIISNSVENNTDNMLNIFINDKNAITSLKEQFNNYLSLCKPLLNICNYKENKLKPFSSELNNVIIDSYSLSLISMPKEMLIDTLNRCNKDDLIPYYLNIQNSLINTLESNSILDIINISESFNDSIPYTITNEIYYTKSNYISHLESILRMLTKYKNYNVILKYNELSSNSICINEDNELIIQRSDNNTILTSTEKNIVSAFWEHYMHLKIQDKKEIVKCIKNIIKKLKNI